MGVFGGEVRGLPPSAHAQRLLVRPRPVLGVLSISWVQFVAAPQLRIGQVFHPLGDPPLSTLPCTLSLASYKPSCFSWLATTSGSPGDTPSAKTKVPKCPTQRPQESQTTSAICKPLYQTQQRRELLFVLQQ